MLLKQFTWALLKESGHLWRKYQNSTYVLNICERSPAPQEVFAVNVIQSVLHDKHGVIVSVAWAHVTKSRGLYVLCKVNRQESLTLHHGMSVLQGQKKSTKTWSFTLNILSGFFAEMP